MIENFWIVIMLLGAIAFALQFIRQGTFSS